eukprot:gnl/MRDRNA2_/MRDRNA2_46746_c0_seq2.p1 gnl/MRDRNA2_/MRDRNA2_46746_c0~~gnl/MRDRNA2_/MRDRNA2_46746_c0_seq2.p1  ORF type:complete len:473 (+),score=122.34 gnl/MRDRNA2_/MRDRNA2_46746_c0_seq2:125-1543(+)
MLDSSVILVKPLLQEASSHRQLCRKKALWMTFLLLSAVVSVYFARLLNPMQHSMGQNLLTSLAWHNAPLARSPHLLHSNGQYAKGLRIRKAVHSGNQLRRATAAETDITASKVGRPSLRSSKNSIAGIRWGSVGELAAALALASLTGPGNPATMRMVREAGQALQDEVEEEEENFLKLLGLSKEMLATAQHCAAQLEEAEQLLELVKNDEDSQRKLLEEVDHAMASRFSAAQAAMQNDDEAAARRHLQGYNALEPKRKVLETDLAAAGGRVASMQASVTRLVKQANEIEQLILRSVVASKTRQASCDEVARYKDSEDEWAFEQYQSNAMFRIQMLMQRLARHELHAINKMTDFEKTLTENAYVTDFEKTLTQNSYVAAERELAAAAAASAQAPAAKTKSTAAWAARAAQFVCLHLQYIDLTAADLASSSELARSRQNFKFDPNSNSDSSQTILQEVPMETHADGTKIYHFHG